MQKIKKKPAFIASHHLLLILVSFRFPNTYRARYQPDLFSIIFTIIVYMKTQSSSSQLDTRAGPAKPHSVNVTNNWLPNQDQSELTLPADKLALLSDAKALLGKQKDISDDERQVRLQVVRAVITGTVIRPSDDSPEIRNPAYWVLRNDSFVIAPGVDPVDAIEDLWKLHGADGVPRVSLRRRLRAAL